MRFHPPGDARVERERDREKQDGGERTPVLALPTIKRYNGVNYYRTSSAGNSFVPPWKGPCDLARSFSLGSPREQFSRGTRDRNSEAGVLPNSNERISLARSRRYRDRGGKFETIADRRSGRRKGILSDEISPATESSTKNSFVVDCVASRARADAPSTSNRCRKRSRANGVHFAVKGARVMAGRKHYCPVRL